MIARKPKPLPTFWLAEDSGVSDVRPPMNTPVMTVNTAHIARMRLPGRNRDNIQIARPSIMKPNAPLTATIQGPTLGRNLPCAAPTASSGAPMPRLIANRARPPRT